MYRHTAIGYISRLNNLWFLKILFLLIKNMKTELLQNIGKI